MEEENLKTYYPMGQRTFFMLVFNRSFPAAFLLVVLGLLLAIIDYVPFDYVRLATDIFFIGVIIFLVTVAFTFVAGWLEYVHYGIFIDEKNIKVKKGFISEEMTGIPYRRIKDVRIERSLVNQIFGVSNIIIVVSGEEEKNESANEEYVTFLPVIEKQTALDIQDTILKRAQVDQVNVIDMHDDVAKKMG